MENLNKIGEFLKNTQNESEIYSADASAFDDETGLDRIKMIFQKNDFEELSPELNNTMTAATVGFFTGATIGGILKGQDGKDEYIRQNKETLFNDPRTAKRALQDKMILSGLKGGLKWGFKFGALTGSYSLLSTAIATYRNDGGFLEHFLAGGIVGSLFRMHLGLRGMVAGGALGLALGAAAGTVTSIGLYFTGTSVREMRYWQHDYWKRYLEKKKEKLKNSKT